VLLQRGEPGMMSASPEGRTGNDECLSIRENRE